MLKIAFAYEHVVVEVVDQGNADWIRVNTNPRKVGGWGLQIVEAVSAEWGVFEGTTHVWAKLPLS